eukprot:SM000042S15335  [mRNA]  locus=s42:470236:475398:+ [translate_table: standard]
MALPLFRVAAVAPPLPDGAGALPPSPAAAPATSLALPPSGAASGGVQLLRASRLGRAELRPLAAACDSRGASLVAHVSSGRNAGAIHGARSRRSTRRRRIRTDKSDEDNKNGEDEGSQKGLGESMAYGDASDEDDDLEEVDDGDWGAEEASLDAAEAFTGTQKMTEGEKTAAMHNYGDYEKLTVRPTKESPAEASSSMVDDHNANGKPSSSSVAPLTESSPSLGTGDTLSSLSAATTGTRGSSAPRPKLSSKRQRKFSWKEYEYGYRWKDYHSWMEDDTDASIAKDGAAAGVVKERKSKKRDIQKKDSEDGALSDAELTDAEDDKLPVAGTVEQQPGNHGKASTTPTAVLMSDAALDIASTKFASPAQVDTVQPAVDEVAGETGGNGAVAERQSVAEGVAKLGEKVAEILPDPLVAMVESVVEDSKSVVGSVADTVLDMGHTLAEALPDPVVEVASTVAESVTDAAGAVADTVVGAAETVADTVTDGVTQVAETVSSAVSSVTNAVSEVTDQVGCPKISAAVCAATDLVFTIDFNMVAGVTDAITGGLFDSSDDEFETFKVPNLPEFRGSTGMNNWFVRQENHGLLARIQDFYAYMLKVPFLQFAAGMFAAPVALSVGFTCLYLLDLQGLALDETAQKYVEDVIQGADSHRDVMLEGGGLTLNWYTLFQILMFSLSLATGLQPEVVPLTPYTLVLANMNALIAELVFVFLSGAVFARLSQPAQPVRCSKVVVICPPSGRRRNKEGSANRVLMARYVLAGPQPCELVDVKVDLTIKYNTFTRSGSYFRAQQSLKLVRPEIAYQTHGMLVRHIIDENSPLYRRTQEILKREDAVISLSVVGLERSSMQSVFHVQHYCVNDGDIVWDAEFADMVLINKKHKRVIDHRKLSDYSLARASLN